MKPTLLFRCTIVLTTVLFSLSCNQSIPVSGESKLSEYQVPLDQAESSIFALGQVWRHTLDSLGISQDSVLPTQSFTISANDLIGVLGPNNQQKMHELCSYNAVRAYLGWMQAPNGSSNLHLFITPVDQNGQDVILSTADGEKFVYDLTTPCPNTCDVNSPLYNAFNRKY